MDHASASFPTPTDISRFRDDLQRHNLLPGYCSLTSGRVSVPQAEWDASLQRLPALAKLAHSLGYTRAATVVLPGHDTLTFPEIESLHITRIRQAMSVLNDFSIRLGLEYVSPKTRRDGFQHPYIHSLPQALDLISKIDRPNVGLMLDTFHWHCAGESKQDLLSLTNAQIVVVHANDAIAHRPTDQQVVNERELPGDSGVIDLPTFFSALREIHYDGPVTCEPTHAKWSQMDPGTLLSRTSQSLRRYLA
jgi:sugar phosphate isomerase/epimerase